MVPRPDVAATVLDQLRVICLGLPEVEEEEAWFGIRWCVRKKNFAHVLPISGGYPPAYARAAGTDGPAVVLTFRSSGDELDALSRTPHPFFKPVWFADIVGVLIDADTDWNEIAELLTESYCAVAPKSLGDRVDRPPS